MKEFDTVLKDLMPTTPPQDFARSDLDNSGNINLDEFGKALKYAGNPTGRGVDHFFNNVVDSNRDGNGSYSGEFFSNRLFTLQHETKAWTACDHETLNFVPQEKGSLQIIYIIYVLQEEVSDCIKHL